MQPKDYLRFRLTGEIALRHERRGGDVVARRAGARLVDEALAASGVDPACAPRLVEGSERGRAARAGVADALGLPRRTVVAAGGGDAAVGAVGIGAIAAGRRVHFARHRYRR